MHSAENAAPMNWLQVCPLEQIPRRGARVVASDQGNIAVFRTHHNEVFALEDKCPHRGGPLSQGIVFGRFVACPLHDWVMHLDTGRAREPDEGCAKRYAVKIEHGMVYLAINTGAQS